MLHQGQEFFPWLALMLVCRCTTAAIRYARKFGCCHRSTLHPSSVAELASCFCAAAAVTKPNTCRTELLAPPKRTAFSITLLLVNLHPIIERIPQSTDTPAASVSFICCYKTSRTCVQAFGYLTVNHLHLQRPDQTPPLVSPNKPQRSLLTAIQCSLQ